MRADTTVQQQEAWLRQQMRTNAKRHYVALMAAEPGQGREALWHTLREAGVELVIVGDDLYAREAAIAQEPTEFVPSPHEGYGRWTPGVSIGQPHLVMLEYREREMAVQAVTADGQTLDQMVLAPNESGSAQAEETVAIGRAPFGFTNRLGDDRKLGSKLKADPAFPAYYFRRTFTLKDKPEDMKDLIVRLSYEDGLILYINGEEVFRDGIRTGLILPSSLAMTNQAVWYRTVSLRNHQGKLRVGSNTLAVQVHRSHPGSPNFLFDLSLSYFK